MPEEEKDFKFSLGILGRSTGKFMMLPSLFGEREWEKEYIIYTFIEVLTVKSGAP